LQIDDERIHSKTSEEIAALLRGAPGSEVRLVVSQLVNKRSDLLSQPSAPYAFQSLPKPPTQYALATPPPPPPPPPPPADALEIVGFRNSIGGVGLAFAKQIDSPLQEW